MSHESWVVSLGSRFRNRVSPSIAIAATLAAGLSARALLSGWIAKYLGVALWATLVYFIIVWFLPRISLRRAFVICVVVSFVVELAQLTPLPMALYELHPFFALVFGTTFNALDLPAYVVGAAIGAAADRTAIRRLTTHDS